VAVFHSVRKYHEEMTTEVFQKNLPVLDLNWAIVEKSRTFLKHYVTYFLESAEIVFSM
jgi:hypothetical protein